MNINELYKIIQQRRKELPKKSYVASLFKKGKDAILQKIGEEAIEVVIAGKNQSKKRMTGEAVDLLFHLVTLLVLENITIQDIEKELQRRNTKASVLQNARSVGQDDAQR